MFTANIEYDRTIRWTRYTGDYISWTNLYNEDLSNSYLTLSLQDTTTKEIYPGSMIKVVLTAIEGPVGGNTPPAGNEDKVVFEFIVPIPSFEIPKNSNYYVEWYDPEEGWIDCYEFNISPPTGDTPLEWIVPFE